METVFRRRVGVISSNLETASLKALKKNGWYLHSTEMLFELEFADDGSVG